MKLSQKNIADYNTIVPSLIVICGPTASGKSGLAVAIAQKLGAVVLSADSRQVYREFNIGTAKASLREQQQVPHYLIDICDPTETLTVAEFQQQAQTLIQKFHELPRPTLPLLVGGTGLYIRSVVRGLRIPPVSPQPDLRSQLQVLGQTQCYAILQQVDALSAEKIHPNDQVRTLRALEVFYVTGQPMSAHQGEAPPVYPILQIGLDCSSVEALQDRIERRTHQMVEAGFVTEVEHLCHKYGPNLPLLNTLGYAEFRQYLAGEVSLAEAERLTVLHTRQFSKRQRTWFRACPEIEWFDPDTSNLVEQVMTRILNFLKVSA